MPPSAPISEALPAAQAELAETLPPATQAALAAALPEARRRLSPRGLDTWLKGLDALHRIGRGEGVLLAWIEAMPGVARDLGEDILPDTANACLVYASRTSGAVLERIIATAPIAARRLPDADLFRGWLALLDHILGRAPRGLRPMLDNLAELLEVLTLGGLRRWADWGAEAHRTDYPAMDLYFALASPQSRAVLQRERKGTLFVDVQRRLSMYLRALWGRDFLLLPSAGEHDPRPHVAGFGLYLPDALDDWQGHPALDLYRAQAAHLAAHIAAIRAPFQGEGLTMLQSLCIGLIEDARAEALAIRRFPRLRDLWAQFHTETGPGITGRFDRIARSLLLERPEDDLSAWALEAFHAMDLEDQEAARALGLALAGRLRGLPFSPHRDRPSAPCRCDNRILWEFEEMDFDTAPAPAQVRKHVSVMEMVNEVEVETAGDDAQEIWVQSAELFDDDGSSFNAREGKPPLAPPVFYDEFDHQMQMLRPAWVTVQERRVTPGDPALAQHILDDNRAVTQRLRHLLDAMRPQGVQRIRKLEDGDDLDVNAAVLAAVDRRLRRQPDPRVMMRNLRKTRDTSVMLLLDLSESTNDPTTVPGQSVLDLTRAAAVLLAEAIHRVGDTFAIHGFCSDGRADVHYHRFKDFTQGWDGMAKARLAGAEGRLSTRMGAAIRHATADLGRLKSARKLMIVVTDGEPADIDVRDPLYLRHDARHAVEQAVRQGIVPFCLTLDPRADAYSARIFGPRNVLILDRVERLPERLPQLYARLTR